MVHTPSRLHRRPHKPRNTRCCTRGCTLTLCHPACRQNEDEGEELTPWGEQEAWEAHQVAQASMKTGAQDKRAPQEYDLVLPDAVEFIAAQAIQGTLVRPPAMSHRLVQVAGCRFAGRVGSSWGSHVCKACGVGFPPCPDAGQARDLPHLHVRAGAQGCSVGKGARESHAIPPAWLAPSLCIVV